MIQAPNSPEPTRPDPYISERRPHPPIRCRIFGHETKWFALYQLTLGPIPDRCRRCGEVRPDEVTLMSATTLDNSQWFRWRT